MRLIVLCIFLVFPFLSQSQTLHGPETAFVDVFQYKGWSDGTGYIALTSEAYVDPSEWGTYTKYNVFDSKSGQYSALYVSTQWTGTNTPIKTIEDAESYFSAWIASHLATYTNPVITTWVELDIADVPDYITWNYINDEENGFIDVTLDWWIDWGPNGTPRYLNSQPDDFGKYLWDGSINPSWIELPLAPVQQGKRLAKGHNK